MAVWPPTLPQFQEGGFDESADPIVERFAVDAGPAKTRRRSTKERQFVRIPVQLTGTELGVFDTFWEDAIAHGATSFEWEHPRTDATVDLRFMKKPVWKHAVHAEAPGGRVYSGVLELEIL